MNRLILLLLYTLSKNRAKNVLILPNYAHARVCVYVYTIIRVILGFSNT